MVGCAPGPRAVRRPQGHSGARCGAAQGILVSTAVAHTLCDGSDTASTYDTELLSNNTIHGLDLERAE